ncbi:MAG: 3-methyl-2-oxobutanoate dehydrogenase subunit beta, partial [Desulfobacterales bacterium]
TAIDDLKASGFEAAMIRPQTLFPFPGAAILEAAAKPNCRGVISIEMSMGQMVEDVQRVVQGVKPVHWYGKCGGEVPTPEEIGEVVRGLK